MPHPNPPGRAKGGEIRYVALARELRRRIDSGEYPLNSRFPSAAAIRAETGLSHTTVLAALRWLSDAGAIRRGPSKRHGYRVVSGPQTPERIEGDPIPLPVKVILPFEHWNFVTNSILHHLERRCSEAHVRLILSNNRNSPEEETALVARVAEHETGALSALILVSACSPDTRDISALQAVQRTMPVVLVDRYLHRFKAPYVGVDNRAVGRRAVEHLHAHGCRHIAYISAFPGISTGRDRHEGYRAAVEELGMTYDPSAVRMAHRASASLPAVATYGHTAAEQLLSSGVALDSVVCNSDKTAVGAINCFREKKLRVPGDIRVVGCDNDELIEASSGMHITGFAYPYDLIAEEVLAIIRRHVQRPNTAPARVELEAEFVAGKTG